MTFLVANYIQSNKPSQAISSTICTTNYLALLLLSSLVPRPSHVSRVKCHGKAWVQGLLSLLLDIIATVSV